MLSIRYNPLDHPPIKPARWKDFQTSTSDPHGIKTQKLLENSTSKLLTNTTGTVNISLSSGIDSTLCVALVRKCFPKKEIVGICGVFDYGFDESQQAKKITKKFDIKFKTVHLGSVFKTIPSLVYVSKSPRWNTYQHLISKEAKKYGNYLVTGDGSDEIFGGYTFRYNKFLNLLQPKNNWKIKSINYLECHNRDWVPDQESLYGKAIKFDWDKIYKYFRTFFSNPLEPLKQVMLADFNGKLLYDFIPTANSINTHYGVAGMPIFLNHDVIKLGLSLPMKQKYDPQSQKGKLVLRKIAKKLRVEHIDKKRGFSPSLWLDWKNNGKKICHKYLLQEDSNVIRKNLINHNWLIRATERIDYDGDQRSLTRMISILALEIWIQIFITKEMSHLKKL